MPPAKVVVARSISRRVVSLDKHPRLMEALPPQSLVSEVNTLERARDIGS